MRRFLQTLFLSGFALVTFSACNISDEIEDLYRLPEATQTGAHTFGCKVDGGIWLPYAEHTLDSEIEAEFDSTYFTVRVERETGEIPYIYLKIVDTTGIKPGTYTIRNGFYATVTMSNKDSLINDELATTTGPDLDGFVTITHVKQPGGGVKSDGILSGTFSFTARSAITNRSTNVTEGRFDFRVR